MEFWILMTKKPSKSYGGRPATYPLDLWCDGEVHVIHLDKIKKSRQAVTEALRRRGRKLRCHVQIVKQGSRGLVVQAFPKRKLK